MGKITVLRWQNFWWSIYTLVSRNLALQKIRYFRKRDPLVSLDFFESAMEIACLGYANDISFIFEILAQVPLLRYLSPPFSWKLGIPQFSMTSPLQKIRNSGTRVYNISYVIKTEIIYKFRNCTKKRITKWFSSVAGKQFWELQTVMTGCNLS